VITILREVAVRNGLRTAKEALEGYGRIIYKILSTGTQVSPDMIQPEAFPDWGPDTKEISDNLRLWRKALPPETLHTTSTSWDVDPKTLTELYLIWHMTGFLDMIKSIDPNLHIILGDVMEELLEEQGYQI
jgi:heterodisulfide reductase subunit C